MKKRMLYTFFFVLVWVGILAVVEGVMRLTGIGYDTTPFQRVKLLPSYCRDNGRFSLKYYPSQPISDPAEKFLHLFPATKPAKTLRIFVLGGSTAQGFPYLSPHSFSGIIAEALRTTGLYEDVEVINLGMSALSSYYVADVAPKILAYHPDAVIIYSGQNEYYGTITSLSRPFWAQKLSLALKEWRIFQWLFSLVENRHTPPSVTLMAQQFASHRIPPDPQKDNQIARDFVRNIDATIRLLSRHHVPVFVYDVVANLIDMPPFSSEGEEEIAPFLASFTNDARLLARSLRERGVLDELATRFPSNAHVLYLRGLDALERGGDFLGLLEQARDMDTTPFRFRRPIHEGLLSLAQKHASNAFFVFIPLREEIIRAYGEQGFGNTLFIDHLHFNRRGQQFLARVFCQYYLRYVHASPEAVSQVSRFFESPQAVEESISYHPYYDAQAESRILGLVDQPPYSLMRLPYHPPLQDPHPFFASLPSDLLPLALSTNDNDFVRRYFIFLYEKGDRIEMARLINAIKQTAPAHPQSYYNIALFLSTTNSFSPQASQAWIMAILLSDRTNRTILTNAIRYFTIHHQEHILSEWRIYP